MVSQSHLESSLINDSIASFIVLPSSSDTGTTAILILHGTPPFVVSYTTSHDRSTPKTISKTFNSQRAEIVLKPERSGTYTYTFTHITDKFYSNVPLEKGMQTTQTVHPLAVAQFVGARRASNCEAAEEDLELDLRVRCFLFPFSNQNTPFCNLISHANTPF